jgi:hypothetical protein
MPDPIQKDTEKVGKAISNVHRFLTNNPITRDLAKLESAVNKSKIRR